MPLYSGSLFERKYRGFYLFGGCKRSGAAYMITEQTRSRAVTRILSCIEVRIGVVALATTE
jgi:hypothetical protein